MPPLPLPACFLLLGGGGGGATTAYQFKRLGPRRSVGRAPTPEEEMEEEEEEEDKMPNHAATWFREGEGGAQITRQRPTRTHSGAD